MKLHRKPQPGQVIEVFVQFGDEKLRLIGVVEWSDWFIDHMDIVDGCPQKFEDGLYVKFARILKVFNPWAEFLEEYLMKKKRMDGFPLFVVNGKFKVIPPDEAVLMVL